MQAAPCAIQYQKNNSKFFLFFFSLSLFLLLMLCQITLRCAVWSHYSLSFWGRKHPESLLDFCLFVEGLWKSLRPKRANRSEGRKIEEQQQQQQKKKKKKRTKEIEVTEYQKMRAKRKFWNIRVGLLVIVPRSNIRCCRFCALVCASCVYV